jgi:hypothetical protein
MTRTSFYQSPHIKEKKIEISYRRPTDGLFQPWGHRIYEDDPSKGAFTFTLIFPLLVHLTDS